MCAGLPAIAVYQAPEFCLNQIRAGNNCHQSLGATPGRIVALLVYICSTIPLSALARAFLTQTAYRAFTGLLGGGAAGHLETQERSWLSRSS